MTRLSDVLRKYIDWSNEGEIVSCADLQQHFGEFPIDQIYKFFHNPHVINVLAENDLAPPPRYKSARSLTDRQRKWLNICTNPYATVSVKALAEANGFTIDEHRRWLSQAHFREEYNKRMRREVRNTEGELFRRTATKAMAGDQKSLENLFKMQGRPLPSGLAAESAGMIGLDAVLQALQETLDSETLARVAARLLTGLPAELESAD